MAEQATLNDLETWLIARNLGGYWTLDPALLTAPFPKTTVVPHLWPWADLTAALAEASDLISLEDAERRSVRMLNPGVGCFTTHTMQMSMQLVNPGEVARAHRHTPRPIASCSRGVAPSRRSRASSASWSRAISSSRRTGPGTTTRIAAASRSSGSTVLTTR
jgi:gentisate 1,2-dioxygenase